MSKEIKVPCQPYILTRQCECGGEMQRVYSDITTLEYPPKYTHKCNKCGKIEKLDKSYPCQMYEYDMPEATPTATMTNRDRLRDIVNNLLEHNFSSPLKDDCKDESIAEVFGNLGTCKECPLANELYECKYTDCEEGILEYLQKQGDEPYVQ